MNEEETGEKSAENNFEESDSKKGNSGNDNVVFVGSKHLMNYVNSLSMQFENNSSVTVKARGKFISKAADISEVAKRHIQGINTKDITINTEQYETNGKKIKVSTIEIVLSK